jgi:hypothetical protein
VKGGLMNGFSVEVPANERSDRAHGYYDFSSLVIPKMKTMKWFTKHPVSERNGNANGDGKPLFTPNPYLNARRQWNSQIDRALSFGHIRLLIDIACLLIALASVAGLTYLGGKSKYVPYVIEVDKLGEMVSVGPAQVAGPADPRVVRASLAQFISALRTVSPDQDLQRKFVFAGVRDVENEGPGDDQSERVSRRQLRDVSV